jgi:hypothetical protein
LRVKFETDKQTFRTYPNLRTDKISPAGRRIDPAAGLGLPHRRKTSAAASLALKLDGPGFTRENVIRSGW